MKRKASSPSSSAGYVPGENFCMCDLCGFRFRASEVREQPHGLWKGLMVCANDYDDYNPQHEDLAAVPEKIVPDKVNIEPDSPLIGTTLRLSFNLIGQLGGATVTDGSQKITADDL